MGPDEPGAVAQSLVHLICNKETTIDPRVCPWYNAYLSVDLVMKIFLLQVLLIQEELICQLMK